MAYQYINPTPGWGAVDAGVKTLDGRPSWAAPDSSRLALDARPGWSAPETNLPASRLPVGTPGNDTLVKFLTFWGEPVIWRVIGKNLDGMPPNSVTLLTDKIVALRCLDASEPKNDHNYDAQKYGLPDWGVSNLRQWLNSNAASGQWYRAQHQYDAPPDTSEHCGGYNAYQSNAGFLSESSELERNTLLATTRAYYNSRETYVDNIFVLTTTELGAEKAYPNNENGAQIPYFVNNASRIAQATNSCKARCSYSANTAEYSGNFNYWTATEYNGVSAQYAVAPNGGLRTGGPNTGWFGVRPACNIPSSVKLSARPDADGCYVILT